MNPPTSAQDRASSSSPPKLAVETLSAPESLAVLGPTRSGGLHLYSFVLGIVVAGSLMGGSLWLLRRPEPPPIVLHPPPTPVPTVAPAPTPTPAPITVFVSGAVQAPGLYMVAPDARVGDALTRAGGLTEQADAVVVNQAEVLWDGAQIHVPALVEAGVPAAIDSASRSGHPPAGVSGLAGAPGGDGSATASGPAGGLVNINAATPTELESLPGIGPSKAAAIVEHRPYATVDDLERVPGIGARTVEQLRAYVSAP